MPTRPQYRTLELPADPLMDGELGIPGLVNKLLTHFGKPTIPPMADLTDFRDALQSMAEFVIPSMPRPSQKELDDRERRRHQREARRAAPVAMADRPKSVQQARQSIRERQGEIAARVQTVRNRVTQAKAMAAAFAANPPQSPADQRLEIAERVARQRGITVEKALEFVPQ